MILPRDMIGIKMSNNQKCKDRLIKTKKVGNIRLHPMVKMRESDLRTIGEAFLKSGIHTDSNDKNKS